MFSISENSNLRVLELFLTWVRSGFDLSLPPKAGLLLPFFKEVSYPLGVLGFVIMTYLVIVGSSNAVNLTDGLDGLAIMPVVMVGSALGIFAYVTGSAVYSKYLLFPHYGEGRRFFRMAPLHHHFEKAGWKETQVVIRFWIITMLLCLVGLSTLKLR